MTKTPLSPSWFRIAVQALVQMASSVEPCSSRIIAHDMDAHAVFLRRVLTQLVRARIVKAREGRAGGYGLARAPEDISLADVYRAVKLAAPADISSEAVEIKDCSTARVQAVLDQVSAEAEQRALDVLEGYSIASVIERAAHAQLTV